MPSQEGLRRNENATIGVLREFFIITIKASGGHKNNVYSLFWLAADTEPV